MEYCTCRKNKTGGNIPLSNIIEFSKNGKPFIRATFEQNKDKIIDINSWWIK